MSLSQVSVKLITEKGRFRVFNGLLNESNLFAILLILRLSIDSFLLALSVLSTAKTFGR